MTFQFSASPEVSKKRIAIIGAGPSGAIALHSFLQRGFKDVTVFERRKVAGGTWNLDEHLGTKPEFDIPPVGVSRHDLDPPRQIPKRARRASREQPFQQRAERNKTRYEETGLYPSVETNILAEFMAFTDRPFKNVQVPGSKERFGVEDGFRSHDVVREYILDYFKQNEGKVLYNTTVERVSQEDGPDTKWNLVLRRQEPSWENEEWWVEDFDFVYVASGRFNVPRVPDIPGLAEAVRRVPANTVIHTKVYRDSNDFRDKKTLLFGLSWSSADVAHAVYDKIPLPLHVSLRSIQQLTVPAFRQPFIEAHGPIAKIEVNRDLKSLDVTFEDGEVLEGVEKLVFGTGYHLSYPFLEDYLEKYGGIHREGSNTSKNLYWTTWWKYDSSLAVSSIITDGITWRAMEAQAKATSYLWAEYPGAKKYTVADVEQWENDRLNLGLRDFHLWFPRYPEFIGGLTKAGTGSTTFPDNPSVDTSRYNDLFVKSLSLKGEEWTRKAEELIQQHPEWQERFSRTQKVLQERTVTL